MPRPNLRRRVRRSWTKVPEIGDTITIWLPIAHRGKKGQIVATEIASSSEEIPLAPYDKFRVELPDGLFVPCAIDEMIPFDTREIAPEDICS